MSRFESHSLVGLDNEHPKLHFCLFLGQAATWKLSILTGFGSASELENLSAARK